MEVANGGASRMSAEVVAIASPTAMANLAEVVSEANAVAATV